MDENTFRSATVIAAFVGPALAAFIAARAAIMATSREAERADQRARAAEDARADRDRQERIRDLHLRQIDDTRRHLTAQLDIARAIILRQATPTRVATFSRKVERYLYFDGRLLGDEDAAVQFAEAMLRVLETLSTKPLLRWIQLHLVSPFDSADMAALDTARVKVLDALHRQEERALRDEPVLVLNLASLTERVGTSRLESIQGRFLPRSRPSPGWARH